MTTTTQTPLDAAIQESADAFRALCTATDVLEWAKADLRGMRRASTANLARRERVQRAEARLAAAVERYDAAQVRLDEEVAKRPDLKVCNCGIPNCDGTPTL